MTSPLQLHTQGGAGLDVAAASVASHHTFHQREPTLAWSGETPQTGGVFQKIGGAGNALSRLGQHRGDVTGSREVSRGEQAAQVAD
jgi:hypothetical protein